MKLLLIFLIILMSFGFAHATNVCGNVSGIWTSAGSPYNVTCDVTVPAGQTLTIQPGVRVLFAGHYRFIVNGNLQALGTEQDSITFTRAYPTDESKWWGIRFVEGASNESIMDYCIIEWVIKPEGSDWDTDGGGVHCMHVSPTFSNCSFRNNVTSRGGGLALGWSAARISHCLINDNYAIMGGAIFCGTQGTPSIGNCTFVRNSTRTNGDAIYQDGAINGVWVSNTIIAYSVNVATVGNVHYNYCDFWDNAGGNGVYDPVDRTNLNGDSCDSNYNIFLNPLFVDNSGDYHLSSASPCIDAGNPGSSDPDSSIVDIGAFSYNHFGMQIIEPNGLELWGLGDLDTIRWTVGMVFSEVHVEINRDFPSDSWEVLFANTPNDGQESWLVTGPSSPHCRIRVSAVSDTLSDISDADFSIVSHISLISPNGAEDWSVFHNDSIRWSGGGFDNVKIELNRNYPAGIWEVLRDSTENDGIETVYVTDPLSTHCRIRISALGDTLSDISDGDFSITASQGYLALARINVPSSSLISWNAGTVECPQVAGEWFHLKNFGSEAVVVFQPQEPVSADFSRTTSCGNFFALAPGQMSPCSLRLTFDPASDGTYRDTLLIQSDAINGVDGSVRIPLSGSQISTPAVPQMVIQPQGEDIQLTWQAVSQSVGGCPVNVARYLVFYAPTSGGPFYYHGYTSGTTYTHAGVVTYAAGMYYQVVAYAGAPALLETLPQDRTLSQAEVMRRLVE